MIDPTANSQQPTAYKTKRVLVTGATGFTGSHLLRYLVKYTPHTIFAMKRRNSPMDLVQEVADKVTWLEGDITDLIFLDEVFELGIQQIYHCAAVVSFDPRDRKKMFEVNADGTANIVNASLHYKIEKLIHISSIAAIGRVKNEPNVSEKNKWQRSPLNSQYAISKYQAEQEVWRGIAEGLNAAIVNPSVILGAQFWENGTGKLFEQVWSGLKFYTTGSTGYVDVRDVVIFMVKLMQSNINNQRFILSAENLTYKTVFESMAKALNKKPATRPVNYLLRGLAWRIERWRTMFSGKRPLITKETAQLSATVFYFDNAASLKPFPDFKYTPIRKTIEETAALFIVSEKSNQRAAFMPV